MQKTMKLTGWSSSIAPVAALLVALAMAFVLACSGLSADEAHAAPSKKAQHKKYEKTIKSYNGKMKKAAPSDASSYRTYFAFADIDKNGIDELVLRFAYKGSKITTADDTGYGERTAIYTITKGKVAPVIEPDMSAAFAGHSPYVRVYKGSRYIDEGFSHGYEDYAFYKFSKGKLAKKPAVNLAYDSRYGALKNGKEISYAKFKKLFKKYAGAAHGKQKGYPMHVYSAKTFKKYV